MALRKIVLQGDEILTKVCRPVTNFDERLHELLDDMKETLVQANGVGLAAPQVGILKRIFVVDVDRENSYVFINPEIVERSGEQTGEEGCLSVPGKYGIVTRANHVKVRALDLNMEPFELEADELLARAIQHEYDHLDGHLYVEKVEGELQEVE